MKRPFRRIVFAALAYTSFVILLLYLQDYSHRVRVFLKPFDSPIVIALSYSCFLVCFWILMIAIVRLVIVNTATFVRCLLSSRRRHQVGHCPSCGYDLRATPTACPECGHAMDAALSQ